MKATVTELERTADGLRCSVEVRGRLPSGATVRERYTRVFYNRKAADEWARERVFALIRGEDESGPAAPTLAKLWIDYEDKHVNGERLKPSQKKALKSLWTNHLEPVFGKVRIDRIDYAAVQAFKAARANKSPKTVNNALIALKAMLRFAHKMGRLEVVPAVELLRVPKTLASHYDVDTFNRLVAAAERLSDRHAAVVLLGGEAGLRAGEILALDAEDVQPPLLLVRRSLWRGHIGPCKGSSERAVPLTSRLRLVLERLATGGPVLQSRKKTRLNQTQLARLLLQAQTAAKVPRLSLHKLRHTYGTDITKALGIRAAQLLLGHADVKTTERYSHAHASPEVAAALEKARAVQGQTKNDAS